MAVPWSAVRQLIGDSDWSVINNPLLYTEIADMEEPLDQVVDPSDPADLNIENNSDQQLIRVEASKSQNKAKSSDSTPKSKKSSKTVSIQQMSLGASSLTAIPLLPKEPKRKSNGSSTKAASAEELKEQTDPNRKTVQIHSINLSNQFASFLERSNHHKKTYGGFRGNADTNPHHSLYKGTYDYQRRDVSSIIRSPPRTATMRSKPSTSMSRILAKPTTAL